MFSEQDLRELMEFRSASTPVLSLYLNVDPTRQKADQYKLRLRSLLKEVTGKAEAEDVSAIERYFDFEFDWQAKGIAVFSCQNEDFWRVHPMAVPVENRVYVYDRPYIKPLTDVLDAYGRYGVIVVDREGARFYKYSLGELEEATGVLGEEVKRLKHGGGATGRRGGMAAAGRRGGMAAAGRREEGVAYRNLKDAAESATRFFDGSGITRLVLGGTEENVSQFKELLPRAIHTHVIGSFSIGASASEAEVQARSMEVIEEAAQEREAERVEQLIAGWKRGYGSAVGLADTLAALQEGRVGILLVSAGYEASGYRCQNCNYLTLNGQANACNLCGGKLEPISDVVDSAVHRALGQGIEVEIVRGIVEFAALGGIGGILRY
jgi:peptide chain release factor subunit 1